jgi:hypothetical protein
MTKWFHYQYYDENLVEIKKNEHYLLSFDDSFFNDFQHLFRHGLQYDKIVVDYDRELMLFNLETVKNTIINAAKSVDIFELLKATVRPWNYSETIEDEIIQMTKILAAAEAHNENEGNPKVRYITFYMN